MPKPTVTKPRHWPDLGHGGGSWQWNEDRHRVELRFQNGKKPDIVRGTSCLDCIEKRDAKRAATAAQAEVLATLANGNGTVNQMIDAWLAYHARGRAPQTQDSYASSVRHIRPILGERVAREVTKGDVQNMYLELVDHHELGEASLSKVRIHLGMAYNHGIDHGYATNNPARGSKFPGHTPKKRKPTWLDRAAFEEMRRYLIAQADTAHTALLLLLLTGMRPGEALGLRWDAVDLDAGIITVQSGLQRSKGGRVLTVVDELKTESSRRVVQITEDLAVALRVERRAQNERRLAAKTWPSDLVFTREDGRCLAPGTLLWHVRQACRAIGVPEVSPNQLRHTHASELLERGESVAVVAKHLGHTDMRMVTTTYGHAQRPHAAVASLLAPTPTPLAEDA